MHKLCIFLLHLDEKVPLVFSDFSFLFLCFSAMLQLSPNYGAWKFHREPKKNTQHAARVLAQQIDKYKTNININ